MTDATSRPSDRELQILGVLWRHGACTVREVHERMTGADVEYNTIGKLLQIMQDKGLVRRDESERAHRYVAVVEEETTQRGLLRDLLARAFDGSAAGLVLRALEEEEIGAADRERIRRMLDEMESR